MRGRSGIERQALRRVERGLRRRRRRGLVRSVGDCTAEQQGPNGHQCRNELPHRRLGKCHAPTKRRALRFFPHTHGIDANPLLPFRGPESLLHARHSSVAEGADLLGHAMDDGPTGQVRLWFCQLRVGREFVVAEPARGSTAMRSLGRGSPSASAVSAWRIADLDHAPLPTRHFTQERPRLPILCSEETRQNSWHAIEVIASRHNRRVESYLQRRRHRPWRNRGS